VNIKDKVATNNINNEQKNIIDYKALSGNSIIKIAQRILQTQQTGKELYHSHCICMWNPDSNVSFFNTAYEVKCIKEEYRKDNAVIIHNTIQTPKGDLTQKLKLIDNIHTVWQTEH
jgi:hypothetical protein